MTQLIDKSALVAEIEKRIKETESMLPKFDQFWAGQISAFKGILKIINSLEVKEVNLEKETKKWWKEHLHLDPKNQLWMDAHQSIVFAKHFFELGLAQKGE